MQDHFIWLIAATVLGIAEMLTGTFFLLVLAVAALAGAAAAWAGLGFWLQAGVAAVVAVAGVLWVQARRRRSPASAMPSLDVGQPVGFEKWVSREAGMARISYRGSTWDARVSPESDPEPGAVLFIEAVEGSVFRVTANKPQS